MTPLGESLIYKKGTEGLLRHPAIASIVHLIDE